MNDKRFITSLNTALAGVKGTLPSPGGDTATSVDGVRAWASFLRDCVKRGVTLADSRWQRVSYDPGENDGRFVLSPKGRAPLQEDEFRVGLQLLLGVVETPPD